MSGKGSNDWHFKQSIIDWDLKFAALLLCEAKDKNTNEYVDCKEPSSTNCLKCGSYFCKNHLIEHTCLES